MAEASCAKLKLCLCRPLQSMSTALNDEVLLGIIDRHDVIAARMQRRLAECERETIKDCLEILDKEIKAQK